MTRNVCFNCFASLSGGAACPYCGYDRVQDTRLFPMALAPGTRLNGQYLIGRVLGQGGFGITYLALDEKLCLKVAVKEYLPEGMAVRLPDSTRVAAYSGEKEANFLYGSGRFLDEARTLAKFAGVRNIASVRTYFEENGTSYFVMDFIEGVSFKTYLEDCGGTVPWQRALAVLAPVLDALAPVHRAGIIHRDVTPDNIYITQEKEIKLLDFGSARYSLGNRSKSLDVILKAGYAPKEQYMRRGKQGPYTDIYSVAACFYTAVTGVLPQESLERMERDELSAPAALGVPLPLALEAAVMKGLALRQEDRWQTAEAFQAALLLGAGMTEPPRLEAPPTPKSVSYAPPTRALSVAHGGYNGTAEDAPTIPAFAFSGAPATACGQEDAPAAAVRPDAPAGWKRYIPIAAVLVLALAAVCFALSRSPEPAAAPDAAQTSVTVPREPYHVEYRIPCKYDTAEAFIDGYARCQKDGKWGFLGPDGEWLVEPLYDSIGYYADDAVIFGVNGSLGYLDRAGNEMIPARYSNAYPFEDGAAAVGTADGKYFFIDKQGAPLFDGASFRYAGAFSGGFAPVLTADGATLLARDGTLAGRCYDKVRALSDGLAAVELDGKWGYADSRMNLVIAPQFVSAGDFKNGYATVEDAQGMYHIDRSGNRIDAQIWDKTFDFSGGYATVFLDGFYGYENLRGEVAIPPRFEDVWSFQDGLCPVKRDGRWFYIDETGKPVLDGGWNEAYIFANGFAKVKKGNFYGLIDRDGNLALPYEFDDLLFWEEGLVPVKRSNRWGYYAVEAANL